MKFANPAAFVSLTALLIGCGQPPKGEPVATSTVSTPLDTAHVHKFCADCHAFPEPSTFPADLWPTKVEEGFEFYHASGRTDLTVPDEQAVIDYFVARAPEQLLVSFPDTTDNQPATLFEPAESITLSKQVAAIATMQAFDGETVDQPEDLFISDMRTGWIWKSSGDGNVKDRELVPWLECLNPARVAPAQLRPDSSGYIICDLGSFFPEDHPLGRVLYAEPSGDGSSDIDITDLLIGVGRVADARPIDADNDGDTDVIVAEFGWHNTGSIQLLRNTPDADGNPVFAAERIDERHGAIHVPVMDLDNDGDEDFVALLSQEFESVVAYLSTNDGRFEQHIIFEAKNPGFGSSGLEPADIDGDGDIDFVYVNGDSLDTPIAKPYHGVQWLENTGSYPFKHHTIAQMPGAHCVKVGDIDLDGDLDLAVSVLLPKSAVEQFPTDSLDSVVWFEQADGGAFRRHRLEADRCEHAACELVDWDADGDLDIITADFAKDANANRPLTLFRNTTR